MVDTQFRKERPQLYQVIWLHFLAIRTKHAQILLQNFEYGLDYATFRAARDAIYRMDGKADVLSYGVICAIEERHDSLMLLLILLVK
ncbi:hypothetical protein D3C85_1273980 [compost metagenome]